MGICRKEEADRKNFQRERMEVQQKGSAKEATVGCISHRAWCLDSFRVALPRCRPGSNPTLTKPLTSLPHFSPEEMGQGGCLLHSRQTQGAEAHMVSLLGISGLQVEKLRLRGWWPCLSPSACL